MSRKYRRKPSARPASRPQGSDSFPASASLYEPILAAMREATHPLYLREIIRILNIRPEAKSEARAALTDLVREGRLIRLKGNRYGLSDKMQIVTGKLSVHPDGFGFVRPDSGKGKDVFIPPRSIKGAVHGDRVVVRVERISPKGPDGTVIRILERATKRVVGTFYRGREICRVVPDDERFFFEVLIPKKRTLKAKNGQVVLAEVEAFSPEGKNPEGRVVEVLGDPDDLGVQVKIVTYKHELPHAFNEEALLQAEDLPGRVLPVDLKGRKDLRDLPLVTIDGVDARDFDDAVFVRKTRTGYTLTVAIADVSHYFSIGSPIDRDAMERGTSVYFPGSVIPMLPEALSNNLCSLLPDKDRLAVVVQISFDKDANARRTRFFKAVIRSHRRFTYSEVHRILNKKDPGLVRANRKHLEHLACMAELAEALSRKRTARGSIDFDLPEPQVILGITGKMEEIIKRERNIAHYVIEEFMIAANEAVAGFLAKEEIPTLYRVHQEPELQKVQDFVEFARSLGLELELPDELSPGWFQKILSMAHGTPQEYVVNTVLLRTMMQAVYSPDNSGHFGLASPTYLHFTSPIRRYPDLVVHRILKANLRTVRKRPVYTNKKLNELGELCSAKERTALEAEREMFDRLKVRFMADKLGEVYEGVISAVTSFGFFVELRDIFVEGVVRLVDLADDYYHYDHALHRLVGKRTGRTFRIGQVVRVEVKSVNISRRHVNFDIAGNSPGRPD